MLWREYVLRAISDGMRESQDMDDGNEGLAEILFAEMLSLN